LKNLSRTKYVFLGNAQLLKSMLKQVVEIALH